MCEKTKLITIQKAVGFAFFKFYFLDEFNIFSFQITLSGIITFIEDKLTNICFALEID